MSLLSSYRAVKLRESISPEAKALTVPEQKEALEEIKDEVLQELDAIQQQEKEDEDEDKEEPTPTTEKKPVLSAPRSAAQSVTDARDRLKKEEERFASSKTARKSEKIMVAKTKQEEEALKQQEKEQKKKEKEEKPKKDFLDMFKFGDKKPKKEEKKEKKEKNAFDKWEEIEKGTGELSKNADKALQGIDLLGKGDKGFAKGIGKGLDASNTGDDIASAAGGIAIASAGVGRSLLQVFESFVAYSKTEGAKADVHLDEALNALGAAAGNLVNLSRSTLNVAEKSGALEAGSAVPILGIVAAIPNLLVEFNELRSAIWRLKKQRKIHKKLKEDPSQQALLTTVKSMMAIDKEAIGKGIAKVFLEFTKIAGHGVSLGGITAPVGIALSTGAAVGKLTISGIGTVEDLVTAHKAKISREKLEDSNDADANERNSKKLIERDPQVAAQLVLDQALLEIKDGIQGGPATKLAKSFGIKVEQLEKSIGDDDASVVSIREMRQKMLYKLDSKDETAETLSEQATGAKEGAAAYLSKHKKKELGRYMEAKNLLEHGKEKDRGKGWKFKMVVLSDDVEEKKKALLEQVQHLISEGELDPNEAKIKTAIDLLQPREKKEKVKK